MDEHDRRRLRDEIACVGSFVVECRSSLDASPGDQPTVEMLRRAQTRLTELSARLRA